MSIAVGYLVASETDSQVFLRWNELLRSHWWPGPTFNGRRQYTVQARNLCVRDFFEWDGAETGELTRYGPKRGVRGDLEALLFWDMDMMPPMVVRTPSGETEFYTQHLDRLLLEHPEAGVIIGLYFSRETNFLRNKEQQIIEFPHEPVAYERTDNGAYRYLNLERMMQEILPYEGRLKLHEVGGGGTGAMLIRKEVLLRMAEAKAPKPIFEAPPAPEGTAEAGMQWTEDLYFCSQLTEVLAEKLWLDSGGECVHQGDRIWISSQHYLAGHGVIGGTPQAYLNAQPKAVNQSRENERRQRRIILPTDA